MTKISDFEAMRPAERRRVLDALRGGATRRDVLGMLGMAGMGLAAGGSVFAHASRALADTPKRGGSIRVAGYTSSTADTLDPAKQTASTDYVRCNLFYNRLTRIDEAGEPQPELAETHRERQGDGLDLQAAQGRHLPRRQGPDRRGRGLFAEAPSRPRGRQQGQGPRRSDGGDQRDRAERGRASRCRARTPISR